MILHDFTGTENHPAYQYLESSNALRLQHFLDSIIVASRRKEHPVVSTVIIKALNYHAISCLHANAGKYRMFEVQVGSGCGVYNPPPWFNVPDLMNAFVNDLNFRLGEKADPFLLSAYSLWRLNHIHPFINGNGRTARALCYYVLCSGLGGLLTGSKVLPELINSNRTKYVRHLKRLDKALSNSQKFSQEMAKLRDFIANLISQQLNS